MSVRIVATVAVLFAFAAPTLAETLRPTPSPLLAWNPARCSR
jgi:hypothetical protein